MQRDSQLMQPRIRAKEMVHQRLLQCQPMFFDLIFIFYDVLATSRCCGCCSIAAIVADSKLRLLRLTVPSKLTVAAVAADEECKNLFP
jgi:hypothetical protein